MHSDSRTKKEELTTYATLGLKRTLKSSSQRRRLLARGAQIVLGSGQTDQPEIMVRRDQYAEVRREVLAEQLRLARQSKLDLSREQLFDCLTPRVEKETYRRLLARQQSSASLDTAFLQTHWRRPTKSEQKIFQHNPAPSSPPSGQPDHWRSDVLNQVLGAIEDKRQNSTGRLQSGWAEIVGAEIAQQSTLEKVEAGIAWFRCLSSPLSYHLQRRPELPAKLAQKLRLPIRQLRAAY